MPAAQQMVLGIKSEQGQANQTLQPMVGMLVTQMMRVTLNLAEKSVLVRNIHVVINTSKINELFKPVNCVFGQWNPWGDCSVTCGAGGFQIASRPTAQQALNGGDGCVGDSVQGQACDPEPDPCPVDCQWAPWGQWSSCGDDCSARDGSGQQKRTRVVGTAAVGAGTPCDTTNDGSEDRPCGEECPGKIKRIYKVAQNLG